MRVLIEADIKATFLRQPGDRENITVIETVGIFNQNIPPMVILKSERHLYEWYRGEMPAHWITAVSPNGWTDALLGCVWFRINFEPHTRPQSNSVEIIDLGWSRFAYYLATYPFCISTPYYLCLSSSAFNPSFATLDVGVFSLFTSEYSKVP